MIILIFGPREVSSVLAHDSSHSVPGITLPPGDATSLSFHCLLGLALVVKKGFVHDTVLLTLDFLCVAMIA